MHNDKNFAVFMKQGKIYIPKPAISAASKLKAQREARKLYGKKIVVSEISY